MSVSIEAPRQTEPQRTAPRRVRHTTLPAGHESLKPFVQAAWKGAVARSEEPLNDHLQSTIPDPSLDTMIVVDRLTRTLPTRGLVMQFPNDPLARRQELIRVAENIAAKMSPEAKRRMVKKLGVAGGLEGLIADNKTTRPEPAAPSDEPVLTPAEQNRLNIKKLKARVGVNDAEREKQDEIRRRLSSTGKIDVNTPFVDRFAAQVAIVAALTPPGRLPRLNWTGEGPFPAPGPRIVSRPNVEPRK